MNTKNLISTTHLSLTKDKNEILKDISIEIKERDFISLIGPNGAGKSMLIKCLMKLIKFNKGKMSHKKNLKIGYVPQKLLIESSVPLSVIEFIMLKEKQSEDLNKKIMDLSHQFNITKILHSPLSQISGGELQKTFLLKALLSNPELLVLDEPEQNLDINSRIDFYKMLTEIYNNNHLAILLASHELNFVMRSTKKVICLFSHVCCTGEPEFVAKDPEFINLFGKKVADMLSVYRHDHQHTH